MNAADFTRRLRALAPTERKPIKAEVPNVGGDETVAVIRLYDPVDSWGESWGVSAKEMATALDGLPDTVTEIRLHINSPGGEVYEGIAILNLLRNHSARVVALVDGVAASAASFIACGADEVVMARNAEIMIHDAWGLCVGNAEDMRKLAEDFDRLSANIASVYTEKAGGTVEQWRAAMRDETWYSADEAVEAGLADRVEDRKATADNAKSRFDLSIFTYAGREEAPAPTLHPQETPAASEEPAVSGRVTPPETTDDDESDDGIDLLERSLQHLTRSL